MQFCAMQTDQARAMQAGAPDDNGQTAEIVISDGNANECRHCMQFIEQGEPMLIFGHRPFNSVQPFAELGPVLLHQRQCEQYKSSHGLPDIYTDREMIVRAYTAEDRIIYGTGKVIPMHTLNARAEALFREPDVAYLHVRSASNNCYHFRLER